MGRAKWDWMEAQDRGWAGIEKHVCAECVEDEHLKSLIDAAAERVECDYCGSESDEPIAAPVDAIMPAVMGALTHYFAEPASAGVPYESAEGGWQVEGTDTEDALLTLPLECHDDLLADIVSDIANHNDLWVSAADGHWASEQRNRQLMSGWQSFSEHVKHRQRYFFSKPEEQYGPDIEPSQLLPELAGVVVSMGLFRAINMDEDLFRARLRGPDDDWAVDGINLGAPPPDKAAAGRMNPAGIPYMYVALENDTAIIEVQQGMPSTTAIARFRPSRTLRVLDLTSIPEKPSVFDCERLRERELLIFLCGFVRAISQPVAKDGREHVEYVPSQIVCEYFACMHESETRLDGILYPSAIQAGGRNLVLFPDHYSLRNPFAHLTFVDGMAASGSTYVVPVEK